MLIYENCSALCSHTIELKVKVDEAITHSQQAQEVMEKMDDKQGLARTYYNYGVLLYE